VSGCSDAGEMMPLMPVSKISKPQAKAIIFMANLFDVSFAIPAQIRVPASMR